MSSSQKANKPNLVATLPFLHRHSIRKSMSTPALVHAALLSAIEQQGWRGKIKVPSSTTKQRELLGNVLIASDTNWKAETLELLDQIWNSETKPRRKERATNMPASKTLHGTKLIVHQGDITALECDAIVNAGNDHGLGCFVPEHRCVDNVIHRAAGPRLRLACKDEMKGRSLAVGSKPIVTPGFHLPSKFVLHVTGPQIGQGDAVSAVDEENLRATYRNTLDVTVENGIKTIAFNGIKTIAFPCISTGLFGFPQDKAAEIVTTTVQQWLDQNPKQLDAIVFDTFTATDRTLYEQNLERFQSTDDNDPRYASIALAKQWIDHADAVLIVAGAGMSVKEGEMVYTNPVDFARHYPWFTKWGYNTSYEVMGLGSDVSVPTTAKWALHSKHMDNMRWKFAPNDGYKDLFDLVSEKDYFVMTSNVDACFERSGFDSSRIYTPQGEWTWLQCMRPCRPDSVFPSRPYIDKILPHISADGFIPENLIPRCPRCGGEMFGNVRGGSWYLHTKYEEQNRKLQGWMSALEKGNKTVVVLEVGAGFNTPTVTRFPAEAFARSLGQRGRLIRINPSDPEVPSDLQAVSIAEGWQALTEMVIIGNNFPAGTEDHVRESQQAAGLVLSEEHTARIQSYLGGYRWDSFLQQLRDN